MCVCACMFGFSIFNAESFSFSFSLCLQMYPLFLYRNGFKKKTRIVDYIQEIPVSMFVSCLSDVCLMVYGMYIEDLIIVVYGSLNSVLLFIVVISIQININSVTHAAVEQTVVGKSDWPASSAKMFT